MRNKTFTPIATAAVMGLSLLVAMRSGGEDRTVATDNASKATLSENDWMIERSAQSMIQEGRRIFRFDTFGSEAFWGDA